MLGRSVTLNVAGQTGGLLIGFVGSILLARMLGPSDPALLALMLSFSTIGLALAGLGLPMAVMYFASRKDASPGALLGNSLLYTAGLTLLFVGGVALLHEPVADLLARGQGGETWILAAALVPLTFFDWTTHNQLLGQLRFGLYNVLVILSKVAQLALIVVLIGIVDLGVAGGVLATAAMAVVMIVGSLPVVLRAERPRLDGGLFRGLVRYGSRVQLGTVFQLLNYRLDVVILQFFVSLEAVGYYVMAQVLAELVTVLAQSFQTSIVPLVTRQEGELSQAETTASSLRHHGLLALGAMGGNLVFGPVVILYALGEDFHPALAPFLILLPGMWFLGTASVATGNLRARGRPGVSSILAGIALAVTIALDLALIPRYGVEGAAIASLVAYTVLGVTSLLTLSRVSGIPARDLIVPKRRDLALYPAALRSLRARARPA